MKDQTTFAQLKLSVAQMTSQDHEPCLVSVLCDTCLKDPDCELKTGLDEFVGNPLDYRALTAYNTELEYHCPLAREFDVHENGTHTSDTFNLTCNWNQTWTPAYALPECICKLATNTISQL